MRIAIVDDHAVVREGLKHILSETPDIAVVAEAATGEQVSETIAASNPDVVLLDISLPGRSGLDILLEIKRRWQSLPVLMLSVHPEGHYAVRALKAGASGYLTKDSAPDELITALRKVARGGRYVSEALAETLASNIGGVTDRAPHEALSDREYEVMRLLATGHTVKQVAQQLSLSVKTISTYRARILEKMSMKNNAELTHYAIHTGLVDDTD